LVCRERGGRGEDVKTPRAEDKNIVPTVGQQKKYRRRTRLWILREKEKGGVWDLGRPRSTPNNRVSLETQEMAEGL